MNHLLDDDVDITGHSRSGRQRSAYDESNSADREISLGVPTILGIFFLLAIICAGFFGFGYSMGRRSAPAVTATVMDDSTPPGSGAAKPTPGSVTLPAAPADSSAESDAPQQTTTQSVAVPAESQPQAKPVAAAPELKPAAAPKAAPAPAAPAPVAKPTPAPAGFMVQVAAVSSQDIADLLTSSLRKKGYTVAVRHEPQDNLLHLQIGPFADKKQAEAMRQRVIADGFNAIVK